MLIEPIYKQANRPMKHTVLKNYILWNKVKYLHTFPKINALIPELRAPGSFFSWSTESGDLVVTGSVVVAVLVGAVLVDADVVVVDVVVVFVGEVDTSLVVELVVVELLSVVVTGVVLPRVVVSEAWLSEEDVVRGSVPEPDVTVVEAWLSEEDVVRGSVPEPDVTVVEALVALLAALVSSVAGEVALYAEVVFAVVWADVELFVVLVLTFCGDSVVVSFVLWVVETGSDVDCVSVEFDDVVCFSDVATSEVNVVATVVAIVSGLSVLPPNIIQPVTRTKSSHKKSIITHAQYIDSECILN